MIFALPQGHKNSLHRQVSSLSVTHGPTHNDTREQIDYHAQVEPVFCSTDIGNISDPFCIVLISIKITLQMIIDIIGSLAGLFLLPASLLRNAFQIIGLHKTGNSI